MNTPQKTESRNVNTCCICGNVPTFVNYDELRIGGVIVCAGFCSIGLDVDLME